MNKKIVCILSSLILLLSGCSQKHYENYNIDYTDDKINYSVSKYINSDGDFSPYDIIYSNNKIIATDSENDNLVIIDEASDEHIYIGKTGNEEAEFLTPKGICINKDGLIYIVDSGNKRIKILTADFEYQSEIDLSMIKFISPYSSFNDIGVDDKGNIYLTVSAIEKSDAQLYFISAGDKKIRSIGDSMTGIVYCNEEKAYFVNTFELYKEDGNDVSASGNNYIYEVYDGSIQKSYEIPYGYTAMGISMLENKIICSSRSFGDISVFDLNGKQGNAIYSEKISLDESNKTNIAFSSVCIDNAGNIYFIENVSQQIIKLKNLESVS